MHYFRKELPHRTLFTPEGAAVRVEFFDNSVGAIVTDDDQLAGWLDSVVGTQGLTRSTKAAYDELKKKTRLDNVKKQLSLQPQPAKSINRSTPTERKGCRSCGGRR